MKIISNFLAELSLRAYKLKEGISKITNFAHIVTYNLVKMNITAAPML